MTKLTKKIAAVALSGVLMAGCFAGCSSSSTSKDDTSKDAKTTYKIGVCQLVQHDALDAATKGFTEALQKLGEENNITFDIDTKNASGDSAQCTTIANQFVADKCDLIMANATPSLQACTTATATTKTPVVGTSVTDYGTALSLKMADGDPTGINVTGTADVAPLDEQAKMILDMFPDTKVVNCIYCSAEANSKFQVDAVAKYLEAKGVKVNMSTFADSNDIQAVATKAAKEADVVYIPTDNTAASNGEVIKAACNKENTPIIAGEEGTYKATDAVATLSISYYDLGYTTGEMAYDILVNGKDPSTMPVQNVPADKLAYKYNKTVAEKYKAIVPDNFVAE